MRLSALPLFTLLCASALAQGKFQDVPVKAGDTLWGIAQAYLKEPTRWNEILRHNKLPTSDPTLALPGMTLRVPVELIREDMRAAKLVHKVRQVLFRKRETASWDPAPIEQQLMRGDGLRTLADSSARVRFLDDSILSLEPDSMAILKPPAQSDHDLRLMRGGVHATTSRVATPSARITPKSRDTKYTARVLEDLSTRVQVYRGLAEVEGAGQKVDVKGGFATEVPLDGFPAAPSRIPAARMALGEGRGVQGPGAGEAAGSLLSLRAEEAGEGAEAADARIRVDAQALAVGIPIAAYYIQVARSKDFAKVVFERVFEVDDGISLRRHGLTDGQYWIRVAPMDLLGTKGAFSEPKPYRLGRAPEEASSFSGYFEVTRPSKNDSFVNVPRYRIEGRADPGSPVTVNGQTAQRSADGRFSFDAPLEAGVNRFEFRATDPRGNEKVEVRRLVYQP